MERSAYESFTALTGIRVREHRHLLGDDVPQSRKLDLERGRSTAWYDADTRTVHLYTGEHARRTDGEFLAGNILYQALSFNTPEELFASQEARSAFRRAADLTREEGSPKTMLPTGTGFNTLSFLLSNASPGNPWLLRLARTVTTALSLPYSASTEQSIAAGIRNTAQHRIRSLSRSGDPAAVAERLASGNIIREETVFLSGASDGMRAAGYPASARVNVNLGSLSDAAKESGMQPDEFIRKLRDAFSDPIAVLENDRLNPDGHCKYAVILDLGGNAAPFLLSLPSPGAVVDRALREKTTDITLSTSLKKAEGWKIDKLLRHALENQEKGSSAKAYLKRGPMGYETDYPVLTAMKKSEPATNLGQIQGSARVLTTDAKIRNNFYNASVPPKNFDPLAEEIARRTEINRLLDVPQAPSAVRKPTSAEILSLRIPEHKISRKAATALQKAGIFTFADARKAGTRLIEELIGTKQLIILEDTLNGMGESLYGRRRTASEQQMQGASIKEQDAVWRGQYVEAFRQIARDDPQSLTFLRPVSPDGTLLPPEAAVIASLKGATLSSRWKGCPVFIEAETMRKEGITPSATAEPTHYPAADGTLRTVYNIEETDLRTSRPDIAREMERNVRAREASGYFRSIVASYAGADERSIRESAPTAFPSVFWKRETADFSVAEERTAPISEQERKVHELATRATMFLAENLRKQGIDVRIVQEKEAERVFVSGGGRANFSAADMERLTYTWNGDEVSLKAFVDAFRGEFKQKDRTLEDADRIASAYIDSVKESPESHIPLLKAEKMSHARYFVLRDGSVWTPQHPMASSPEYETQHGLWRIYSTVLGDEKMQRFVSLLNTGRAMTQDEQEEFAELERRVNGSELMQLSLEENAETVNQERLSAIRGLIQYLEASDDYTLPEKAVILKGAMTWGVSEKKSDERTDVALSRITDANTVGIPVVGGDAARIVEHLRQGYSFKDSLRESRLETIEQGTRSVPRNFTGWKVYPKSSSEEDAAVLQKDAAGTGWCTGGGLSTARSHLAGGDFHIYFEAGEPLIAIRTKDGRLAEPPRGAHDGQFCTPREEEIAFSYIRNGNGIEGGEDYIADMEDLRRINAPWASWEVAIDFPRERRYNNGEYGGNTKSWGDSVNKRVAQLMESDPEGRHRARCYTWAEITEDPALAAECRTLLLHGEDEVTLEGQFPQLERIVGDDRQSLTVNREASLPQLRKISRLRSLAGNAELHELESVSDIYAVSVDGFFTQKAERIANIFCKDIGIGITRNCRDITVRAKGRADIYGEKGATHSINIQRGAKVYIETLSDESSVYIQDGASLDCDSADIHDLQIDGPVDGIRGIEHVINLVIKNAGKNVVHMPDLKKASSVSLKDSSLYTNAGIWSAYIEDESSLLHCEEAERVYVRAGFGTVNLSYIGKVEYLEIDNESSVIGISECETVSLGYFSKADSLKRAGIVRIWEPGAASLDSLEEVKHIIIRGGQFTCKAASVGDVSVTDGSLDLPNAHAVKSVSLFNGSLAGPRACEQLDLSGDSHADTIRQAGKVYTQGAKASAAALSEAGDVHLVGGAKLDSLVRCDSIESNANYIPLSLREIGGEEIVSFRIDGKTVYGYQIGSTIYLTPEGINPNTPIHEYAHMWAKVFQHVRPEAWEMLKGELKSIPEWKTIAQSDAYVFLGDDEDRLAGEVLATVVGNRGEEFMKAAARMTVREGVSEALETERTVEHFREVVTNFACEEVFGIDGTLLVGAVTLQALQDYTEGRGLRVSLDNEEAIAAMAGEDGRKKSTGRERNGAVAGNSSSVGLSGSGQGAPKPSFLSATLDNAKIQRNVETFAKKIRKYQNEHDLIITERNENEIVRRIGSYFSLERSRSSHSYYNDYYEGTLLVKERTVRVRISNHPASRDRVAQSPTNDYVSIVVYKDGETKGKGDKPYIETIYYLSQMSPEMIVESIGEGLSRVLEDGLFFDKFGVFKTLQHEGDKVSVLPVPEFSLSLVDAPDKEFAGSILRDELADASYRMKALSAAGSGLETPSLPRNVNGNAYTGMNAVYLIEQSVTRHLHTPYFISAEQMETSGLKAPSEAGIPLFRERDGKMFVSMVFPLEQTDFKEKFPGLIDALSKSGSPEEKQVTRQITGHLKDCASGLMTFGDLCSHVDRALRNPRSGVAVFGNSITDVAAHEESLQEKSVHEKGTFSELDSGRE